MKAELCVWFRIPFTIYFIGFVKYGNNRYLCLIRKVWLNDEGCYSYIIV